MAMLGRSRAWRVSRPDEPTSRSAMPMRACCGDGTVAMDGWLLSRVIGFAHPPVSAEAAGCGGIGTRLGGASGLFFARAS